MVVLKTIAANQQRDPKWTTVWLQLKTSMSLTPRCSVWT